MTIDSHIHYSLMTGVKPILKALDDSHADKAALMSINSKYHCTDNIDSLYAKYCANGRLYAFGALDPTLYLDQTDFKTKMVEHVKNLMKCGFDGIKMLEGKPSSRKQFPIPDFDSDLFEPYWDYVEKNNIPVTMHLNDPEEFWDPSKTPEWAKKSGWAYGFGGWVNNEDQYKQMDNVLKRHKNLKITFAHFCFLSAQLDRLSKIFDSYPNVCVDIVPGIELFENLSKNIIEAKKFFNKYQDRILYGTDISLFPSDYDVTFSAKDFIVRGKLCHEFLTLDKVFIKGDENGLLGKDDLNLNGLNLDKEIVDKILYKTFLNRVGEVKKVNIEEVLKEIEREKQRLYDLTLKFGIDINYKHLSFCKNFFLNEVK